MLYPGKNEIDIDMCVPSTTLAAFMLRWMLVFEERDTNTLWLLKAAPRRFYAHPVAVPQAPFENSTKAAGNANVKSILRFRFAPTRFGEVDFSLGSNADAPRGELHFEASLLLNLHGRGSVSASRKLAVIVRLRDPAGNRTLRAAEARMSSGAAPILLPLDINENLETARVHVAIPPVGAPQLMNVTLTAVLA